EKVEINAHGFWGWGLGVGAWGLGLGPGTRDPGRDLGPGSLTRIRHSGADRGSIADRTRNRFIRTNLMAKPIPDRAGRVRNDEKRFVDTRSRFLRFPSRLPKPVPPPHSAAVRVVLPDHRT